MRVAGIQVPRRCRFKYATFLLELNAPILSFCFEFEDGGKITLNTEVTLGLSISLILSNWYIV